MFASEVKRTQILPHKGNKKTIIKMNLIIKSFMAIILKIFRQISIDSNKPIPRTIEKQKTKLIELEKAETGNVCVGF